MQVSIRVEAAGQEVSLDVLDEVAMDRPVRQPGEVARDEQTNAVAGQEFYDAHAVEASEQANQLRFGEPVAPQNPLERPSVQHTDGNQQQRRIVHHLALLFDRERRHPKALLVGETGEFKEINVRQFTHRFEAGEGECAGGEEPLHAALRERQVPCHVGV